MPPTSAPVTGNLPGQILLILIIAIPLAFAASMVVLSLYRRAVLRGMQTRTRPGRIESVTAESHPSTQGLPLPRRLSIAHPAADVSEAAGAYALYVELLRGPWRVAAVYAVAGCAYAFVTTIIFFAASGIGFSFLSFLIIFWHYAWPIAITICLVAAPTWRMRFVVFAIYFLVILLLGAVAAAGNSSATWLEIISLWFITNFPAALLMLVFLSRRVQAVGPFVLTFMIFATTGMVVLPPLIARDEGITLFLLRIGSAVGLGIWSFLVLPFLGFALFGTAGWLVLRLIGHWYQNKRISEQSITLDTIWLLFGLFQSIGLLFEGEFWFLAGLLSFAVYKIVALAGFALTARPGAPRERRPNLLLLRVFSLGKRSERLFDLLALHWRFVGSMGLIAGPDLAATTMEPHEFLDLLGRKLRRRFIESAETLERRLTQIDHLPDPDGQFRVNDFFCYDDTWKMVLSRLVQASDVVIMDLRGFSSQNAGCIFEINELVSLMPLDRVVFITDDSTDEAFLRQVLQQAWEQIRPDSPNRSSASGAANLLHLDRLGTNELQKLLSVLSYAATGTPKTVASA